MSRIERVNQTVKKELSDIVQTEVRDPRLGFVTITRVEVSKDLQHAKVFFTVLGQESQIKETQKGLSRASGYIRRLVGQRVRLRYIPQLNFIFDQSLEDRLRLEKVMQDIRQHQDEGGSSKGEAG